MEMRTSDLFVRNFLTNFASFFEKSDVLFNLHRVFFLKISFFIPLKADIIYLLQKVFQRKLVNGAKNHRSGRVVEMIFTDKLIESENGVIGELLQLGICFLYF